MRIYFEPIYRAAIALLLLLLLHACAAPDSKPAVGNIGERAAEVRAEELELVRSTVSDAQRADRLVALMG